MVKIPTVILCSLFITASFACKKANQPTTATTDTLVIKPQVRPVIFAQPNYDVSNLDSTITFETIPQVNNLFRKDLLEISGVAASRQTANVLYIHNDSGNANQIYLTNASGADIGTLTLNNLQNRDWEDIAVGPGPIAGKNYVYVGNIGDNDSKYQSVYIYRFLEPDLNGKTLPVNLTISDIDVIELKYPDSPRNAESLMVDPLTKDIYIASKESNVCKIYLARYPQNTTSINTLAPVAQLNFNKATAADISSDGKEILLRNKEQIWYWKVPRNINVAQAFLTKPQIAPYFNNELQGEGIGFAADGSGYYTDTEVKKFPGNLATISFYKRK
jgi:hypothetical protein